MSYFLKRLFEPTFRSVDPCLDNKAAVHAFHHEYSLSLERWNFKWMVFLWIHVFFFHLRFHLSWLRLYSWWKTLTWLYSDYLNQKFLFFLEINWFLLTYFDFFKQKSRREKSVWKTRTYILTISVLSTCVWQQCQAILDLSCLQWLIDNDSLWKLMSVQKLSVPAEDGFD